MSMMVLLGAELSGIMVITAGGAMGLMLGNNTQTALHLGIQYIAGISVFYALCHIGNAFVGYYRGVGMVNVPVIGTVLHISICVILSYLLVPHMGLLAVAVATGIGWIAVVLFQSVLYFRKNPWTKAEK